MTNKFGDIYDTPESHDEAYFKYIRDCIIESGIKEMYNKGIDHLEFEYYFDSQRRININSEIIGEIDKENVDLDGLLNYISNCNRDVQPYYDNTNHFGDITSFKLYEHSLLSSSDLFDRHKELNKHCFSLFLPRNNFDYLMGFVDEFKI